MATDRATTDRPRTTSRPGPRLVIEVLLLLAAVAGYETLRHRGTFPRPTIRALRSDNPAARADALRSLSQFGAEGADAIPDLIAVLERDPVPSVRRGAAFVLATVAQGPRRGEPFTIGLFRNGTDGPADEPPPGPPHARGGEVAGALVAAMEGDPDSSVSLHALRSLVRLLGAATGTRSPTPRGVPIESPPPEPPRPASEIPPWAFDAARAIARRVDAEDHDLAIEAAAWAFADPAAAALLDEDARRDALIAAAGRAIATGQQSYVDRLVVNAAAVSARPSARHREAFCALAARVMARPEPEGAPVKPAAMAYPFWLAGPTADQLREHPEALDGMVLLLGPDSPYVPHAGQQYNTGLATQTILDDALTDLALRDGIPLRSIFGVALDVARRDPRVLDLLGKHAGAIRWDFVANTPVPYRVWSGLLSILVDPEAMPTLPADRAEVAADRILDALDDLSRDPVAPRFRCLALAGYFLRGAGPDAPAADRLERLLIPLRVSRWPPHRAFGEVIHRSLPRHRDPRSG